ncbi:MAG: metallophosphoesterase [Dissulfurispiraceae bacterium]
MYKLTNKKQLPEISRRDFLQVTALAVIVPLVDIAVLTGTDSIEFTHHDISPSGASSESVILAQLSDLHLRTIVQLHNFLAEKVNAEKPDAILITGDAIDGNSDLKLLDNFLKLLPNVPKVAILGNHELDSDVNLKELAKIYKANNGVLLINRTVPLAEKGSLSRIFVTGLDDPILGSQNLEEALRHASRSPNHILMAHRPLLSDGTISHLTQLRHQFNLMIAGHTHGGQINIFGMTPFIPEGCGHYVKGWYNNMSMPMYVSRGIGTVVIPVRIGASPEVAIFKYYVS